MVTEAEVWAAAQALFEHWREGVISGLPPGRRDQIPPDDYTLPVWERLQPSQVNGWQMQACVALEAAEKASALGQGEDKE